MRDVANAVPGWLAEGRRVALAVVLETWGSAPRRPGAMLAVADDGRMAGSVSGGCVEAAVVDALLGVLEGAAGRVLAFDVADDAALAVGLPCGGRLAVLVAPLPPDGWERLIERAAARAPLEIAWLVGGNPARIGSAWFIARRADGTATAEPASPAEDDAAGRAIAAELAALPAGSGPCTLTAGGAVWRLHRHAIAPEPRVLIVGGAHVGVALARALAALGWEVMVIDPRASFLRAERFPAGTGLNAGWPAAVLAEAPPDPRTAVVALSHDPKLDDGALAAALTSGAFYVGALGSRRTAAARRARLLRAGVPAEALDQLRAPVGLAIGAVTPEEIAVAVAAELVQAWRAGPGREERPDGPLASAADGSSARSATARGVVGATGDDRSARPAAAHGVHQAPDEGRS